MWKKNFNDFWTVNPIWTKFDIQHQLLIRNKSMTGNREIWKTRWPPAAILKFTKTLISPEPLVRFSPNLVWSFVSTPPRQRNCQNRHFEKSKMAADEKPKFTENGISSKRFVLFAPNLVRIIYSTPGTSPWSQNREIHNPRWPMATNIFTWEVLVTSIRQ